MTRHSGMMKTLGCAALLFVLATLQLPHAWAQQPLTLEQADARAAEILKRATVEALRQSGRARVPEAGKPNELQAILDNCSESARREFLRSLVLVNGRLASAQFSEVEGCLDRTRYAKLMGFFKLKTVYPGKKCNVIAECEKRPGSRCTSNCGNLPAFVPGKDARNDSRRSSDPRTGYVSLAAMTHGCSIRVRNEFLEGLVFADGRLKQAPVHVLLQCPEDNNNLR